MSGFHLLLVFIDGVGLGPAHPGNPLTTLSLPAFAQLAGDHAWTTAAPPLETAHHVFKAIDANLGVEGLPQSGTGQATLFTGVNGAALAGRHYGPFPHSKTRAVLATSNVFHRVQALFPDEPIPCAFANAYPDRFFELVAKRDRWTVTTRCCLDANVRIRTAQDLAHGTALPADITGAGWRQFDPTATVLTEAEAAQRLLRLAQHHRFTLFEYFLTDKAGHSQKSSRAADTLHSLDRFFEGLLANIKLSNTLLLITSDHGNLEDLSVKTHTRNPVPLLAYGNGAHHFADAQSLIDVLPLMEAALLSEKET